MFTSAQAQSDRVNDYVDLSIDRDDNGLYQVMVENRLAGPIEVGLRFVRSNGIYANPALPLTATISALSRQRVTTLQAAENTSNSNYDVRLESVPGAPQTIPDEVIYQFPLASSAIDLSQGFNGGHSHDDAQNRFAIDLAAPSGTPVRAARDGVVMQVIDRFTKGGLDPALLDRSNLIRILHSDGSMAIYAHLHPQSAQVRLGESVRAGQTIAQVGSTGYSSGPHLHFAVQINVGMKLVSVRFQMDRVSEKLDAASLR